MEFEWDESKAATNLNKHGVSFEEAKTVFDNPQAVIFDPESVNKALRALIEGISQIMNEVTIEQRLATLEQTVADLKRQINDAPTSSNWQELVIGSISDEPAFLEALEYGRAFRHADKPTNQFASNEIAEQALKNKDMLLPDTDKSTDEADNLQ
ncbi:hypothetical protein A6770_22460 [Nostoc minutum NIES-26]|uniref:Uncharacterized protein n=1 Tax=Nostoc minutum NIES-26 TaxID=1844469 RepID=A0A367QYD0_9NOSO|nr:hypothetical protein A6770_22460 [Nostoc minutum NIES-26]